MSRSFYWQCTADATHKSADWKPQWLHHWGTKYCAQCGHPMEDVRTQPELDRLMARSEEYRKGKH